MKLELISPKNSPTESGRELWDGKFYSLLYGVDKYSAAPLALPVIAALTPEDIAVSITDENIEPINFDKPVDLVGVTCSTWLAPRAYEIADEFRQRGVTVVLGGIHPSMLPYEAIQHADAVVMGEAENVWKNLVEDFKENRLRPFYKSSQLPELEDLPLPRWDLLKNKRYFYHTIQTTRGCPYNCEFCTVKAMSGGKYRYKPVKDTIKEVETLLDIEKKLFFFVDDNFIGDRNHARQLLRELIPLKIVYFAQVSLNLAKDEELLSLLAESGCRKVIIGFESLVSANLEQMGKDKSYKVEQYGKDIMKIQSWGIEIQGFFIFGYDFDDDTAFEKTVDFINSTDLAIPILSILTPLPGTRLFGRFDREGRLLYNDWQKYDGRNVCFRPKLMSPKSLQNGYNWAMQQVNSYESIFKRLRGIWNLWNRNNVRLQDRISPITVNLAINDVARSLPEATHPGHSKESIIQSVWEVKK
ncbi:MAG: B12-binding domain-containing radical SAM protein [Elusimicrobiota bacterium]|nr:B12-binding domain-containing radical SAM protein [Elusimicrobiota bacterium]MDH5662446.1 B12-binding domain-containing radical SAM protein [Elusimicrobiota bacterium]